MIEVRDIERSGILTGLDLTQRGQVLAVCKPYAFGPGEVLLAEGESDRSMLLVVDGELEVTLGGVPLARIKRSALVGEMALFGTFDRRSATVTSVQDTRALALDQEGLRFLRLADNPVARSLERLALRTVAARLRATDQRIAALASGEPVERRSPPRLLEQLGSLLGLGAGPPRGTPPRVVDTLRITHGFAERDEAALNGLAARLEMLAVASGETVVHEGQPADDAFIVAEGRIGVYCSVSPDRAERVATLGPGSVFGVAALTVSRARTATCRALEPTYLARIPAAVFRELEAENSPEGRAFRRGLIDALAVQVRLANEHLLKLERRPVSA